MLSIANRFWDRNRIAIFPELFSIGIVIAIATLCSVEMLMSGEKGTVIDRKI
jgi:hypothetical protein